MLQTSVYYFFFLNLYFLFRPPSEVLAALAFFPETALQQHIVKKKMYKHMGSEMQSSMSCSDVLHLTLIVDNLEVC